uniref:Clc-like protein n=1 Tax=Plectus sambesii TaxID=2011161 RepID=A0A914XRD8_9BILA
MNIANYALLVAGWVLMGIAIIWSIASVASPAWQVVDLREYQTIHYHGLWQDCARTSKTGYYAGSDYQQEGALHCTYKFDYSPGQLVNPDRLYVDENSPAGENQYHTWNTYQVVPLVFIMLSVICGIIALIVSCGILRYPICAIIFTIMSFISLVLSFAVVSSFFIVAHRGENRFIKGVVGTYEALLGRAYYFELVSCIFFLLTFLCSLFIAYRFKSNDDASSRRRILGSSQLDTAPNFIKVQPVTLSSERDYSSSNVFHGYESKF